VINRRIAITPIHLDLTGRRLLRQLKTWNWTLAPDGHDESEGDPAARMPGPDRAEAEAADERLSEEHEIERR
jgi:hypothetical protein